MSRKLKSDGRPERLQRLPVFALASMVYALLKRRLRSMAPSRIQPNRTHQRGYFSMTGIAAPAAAFRPPYTRLDPVDRVRASRRWENRGDDTRVACGGEDLSEPCRCNSPLSWMD